MSFRSKISIETGLATNELLRSAAVNIVNEKLQHKKDPEEKTLIEDVMDLLYTLRKYAPDERLRPSIAVLHTPRPEARHRTPGYGRHWSGPDAARTPSNSPCMDSRVLMPTDPEPHEDGVIDCSYPDPRDPWTELLGQPSTPCIEPQVPVPAAPAPLHGDVVVDWSYMDPTDPFYGSVGPDAALRTFLVFLFLKAFLTPQCTNDSPSLFWWW